MDTLTLQLLESIKDRPRYLSLSQTPVQAITAGFKMIEDGLATMWHDEYGRDVVRITEKGKKVLEENNGT